MVNLGVAVVASVETVVAAAEKAEMEELGGALAVFGVAMVAVDLKEVASVVDAGIALVFVESSTVGLAWVVVQVAGTELVSG